MNVGNQWKWDELGIGPKVVASTLVVFSGLLGAGAYFLGQQLEADLNRVLSNQASIIEKANSGDTGLCRQAICGEGEGCWHESEHAA